MGDKRKTLEGQEKVDSIDSSGRCRSAQLAWSLCLLISESHPLLLLYGILVEFFVLLFLSMEINVLFLVTSALEEFTQMYIDTNMTTDAALEEQGYSSVSDFVNEYVDQSLLEGAADIEPSSTILNPDSPIRLGFLNGDLHQLAQFVAKDMRIMGDQTMFEMYGVNVVNAIGAPFANGGAVMTQFAAGTWILATSALHLRCFNT